MTFSIFTACAAKFQITDTPWREFEGITPFQERAIRLYGILHARFLLTMTALDQAREEYSRNKFSYCHQYSCKSVTYLRYGQSDELNESILRLYYANCNKVYVADNSDFEVIDGAFFRPWWIHLFIYSFPEIVRTLRGVARSHHRAFLDFGWNLTTRGRRSRRQSGGILFKKKSRDMMKRKIDPGRKNMPVFYRSIVGFGCQNSQCPWPISISVSVLLQ
jgi:hypothetical protein